MGFFLFLMSLIYIVEGVLLILTPKKVMRIINKVIDNTKEPKLLGVLPLVVGILFLLSTSASAVGWLIILLGLAGIAKAVYIFITPMAKIRSHWWFKLSDNGLRGFGILVLILGVIIFISRV